MDSSAAAWEPHFGMGFGRVKTLRMNASGEPLVYLTRSPGAAAVKPSNHPVEKLYHRTVTERIFVVAGELHMREYQDPDDPEGEAVLLRQGLFVDRRPGSVHRVVGRSPVGFMSLEIRSHSGNYDLDLGSESENINSPA